MLDIFESNERLIKEDLLALGVGDAVLSPVFVLIPIVPFKTDTIIQFVVDSHPELYITIIYIPQVEKPKCVPIDCVRRWGRKPGDFSRIRNNGAGELSRRRHTCGEFIDGKSFPRR